MTAPAEVTAAWDALTDHSIVTCPTCRSHEKPEECPEAWELYRAWKRHWIAAGRPIGLTEEASA